MRILIVSDIHSNWPALHAVAQAESFDHCLCAGDIVDYATDPLPCVEWVQSHVDACVRGNHDHAVAQRIRPKDGGGFRALARATRPWHWHVLKDRHLDWLGDLPLSRYIELGGQRFFLVHGTPRDPLDEYLGKQPEVWSERLADVEADFVCVGHTHIPFQLDLGRCQVINPGSVGQPRDGDPRASYAVWEDGAVRFERCEYDLDLTIEQMREAGLSERMRQYAEDALRNGGRFSLE